MLLVPEHRAGRDEWRFRVWARRRSGLASLFTASIGESEAETGEGERMPRERPEGLVQVHGLTPHEQDEVEALRGICRQPEERELPLPGNEENQFLYYAEGSLVGFVSLPVEEPEGSIELVGMVHPGYRR